MSPSETTEENPDKRAALLRARGTKRIRTRRDICDAEAAYSYALMRARIIVRPPIHKSTYLRIIRMFGMPVKLSRDRPG